MNALDKVRRAKEFLENSGVGDADREAELIVAYCLGTHRTILYRDNPGIPESVFSEIDELLKRRAGKEPLQYILGYTEFYGLEIRVGAGVLIPRPETELLAEEAIKALKRKVSHVSRFPLNASHFMLLRILDICTGSGCLALTLAKEFPDAEVYGTDTSEAAINYAEQNRRLNAIENARFLRGSLFDPIKKLFAEGASPFTFDLIISNPPYIRRNDIQYLQPEIKEWEPLEALDGGEDGLDYYRMIIPVAGNYLSEGGLLMLEIGIGQAEDVKRMARDAGFSDISLIRDYAGIERIITATVV